MWIDPVDLEPFATIEPVKAAAMIADAEAQAALAAPCLGDATTNLSDSQAAAVKAVLRRALLRWHEAGNAGQRKAHQQTAGPFGEQSTFETTGSRGLFWPQEIADLQAVCRLVTSQRVTGAYTVDMTGLSSSTNPLAGTVINAGSVEPVGTWSDEAISPVPTRWLV